jgi:DNA-binding NtrC family response regulator
MSEDSPVVAVIDDDPSVRDSLAHLVRSLGLSVETFGSAQEFLTRGSPDGPACLVLDATLPGLSGLDLQRELAKINARIPTIFISGHADVPTTVRAMKGGAIEFLTKPCRDEDLLNAIEEALHPSRQLEQPRGADETSRSAGECRSDIGVSQVVGHSEAMRRVLKAVDTVAPTDSTVLIGGETGTGKELIARAIHNRSRRRSRPFVTVNCAAIPSTLLESELFGHEKGAFTGALVRRIGRFELADGGTLFLDEIGDIPLELQPKLLRVLQEQEFERLGSTQTLRVGVRLVAATNVDLATMVAGKRFRSDLYYRLNVFPIVIPPLRDRREDIPALVDHFMRTYARRLNRRIEMISPSALKALTDYDWPGNVRELANVIERASITAAAGELRFDLPLSVGGDGSARPAPAPDEVFSTAEMKRRERDNLAAALRRTQGKIYGEDGAARLLGIKPTTLLSRLTRLGLKPTRRVPRLTSAECSRETRTCER